MEKKTSKTLQATAGLIAAAIIGTGCVTKRIFVGPEEAVLYRELYEKCKEINGRLQEELTLAEDDLFDAEQIIDGLENCP